MFVNIDRERKRESKKQMDIDGRKENKRLLSSMSSCHCAITLSQMSRICSLLPNHLLSIDMFHRDFQRYEHRQSNLNHDGMRTTVRPSRCVAHSTVTTSPLFHRGSLNWSSSCDLFTRTTIGVAKEKIFLDRHEMFQNRWWSIRLFLFFFDVLTKSITIDQLNKTSCRQRNLFLSCVWHLNSINTLRISRLSWSFFIVNMTKRKAVCLFSMLDIDHRLNSIGQEAFEELCLSFAYHDLQFSEQIEDTTDFFIKLSRRARHSSSEHPIIWILLHERFQPQERKDSTGHRVYIFSQQRSEMESEIKRETVTKTTQKTTDKFHFHRQLGDRERSQRVSGEVRWSAASWRWREYCESLVAMFISRKHRETWRTKTPVAFLRSKEHRRTNRSRSSRTQVNRSSPDRWISSGSRRVWSERKVHRRRTVRWSSVRVERESSARVSLLGPIVDFDITPTEKQREKKNWLGESSDQSCFGYFGSYPREKRALQRLWEFCGRADSHSFLARASPMGDEWDWNVLLHFFDGQLFDLVKNGQKRLSDDD